MSTAAHRRLHLSLTSGAKRLGALLVFCGCSGAALAVGMCPGDGQALFTDPIWGFPHVGGVLLDKSLTLLNEVDNIEAAAYDSATGEIVLVGQGTVPIDERIELDDLVVAVKIPSDDAATKPLWLALSNITADWGRPAKDWKEAMNQFAILYEDRFTRNAV